MSTILLVCSGPGAQLIRTAGVSPECKVACVNDSYRIVDAILERDPDFYGVFENKAAHAYRSPLEEFASKGCAYMRPHNAELINLEAQAHLIDHKFGPVDLHYLHLDRMVLKDPAAPETWISSGVLMAWVLLEREKPTYLYVAGADGYDLAGLDYAPQVTSLDPYRSPEWITQMNQHMGDGWEALSKKYTKSRITFLGKPNHWRDAYRARYADRMDEGVL